MPRLHPLYSSVCSVALFVALAIIPARADNPATSDLMKLNQAAGADSASAVAMIPNLRSLLANAPDSSYASMMRQMLVRALVTSKAQTATIAAAADTAGRMMVGPYANQVGYYASVAQVLADRGDGKRALTFGRKALAALPANDQTPGLRGFVYANLGFAHFESGRTDSAITYYVMAIPITPDSVEVLRNLGAAYRKAGKKDDAISAYVRSLSVFPAKDTTGTGALQAAYRAQHGSLDGLDAQLAAGRKASREKVALQPRRRERAAPAWTLQDVDGKEVRSDAFTGKVMVVDFWGSWCGPCRMELPMFEALYQRYRENPGVQFYGINWERDTASHAQRAREYMTQNHLTFPNVIDPLQSAVRSYDVQGFPSVYVIDSKGRIRYQNVGVADNIDDILEAQIESLLE